MNSMLVGAYEYWPLLNLNASINGNTLVNGGSVTFGPGAVSGEGYAIFDGASTLTRPSNSSLQGGNKEWEYTCWHLSVDPDTAGDLISKNDPNGSASEVDLVYGSDRSYSNFISGNNGTVFLQVSVSGIDPSVPHFLDTWYDPADRKLRLQVDGGAIAVSSAFAGGVVLDTTAFDLTFGGEQAFGNLIGKIGSLARFNTLRTTGQRTLLYGGGAGLPFSQWDSGGAALQTYIATYRALKQRGRSALKTAPLVVAGAGITPVEYFWQNVPAEERDSDTVRIELLDIRPLVGDEPVQ